MKTATFGTDGIRGIYGKTITEETAYRLGAALGKKGNVLIGRDNRLSSPSLAQALAGGVKAAGSAAQAVGCVTTPALYYLLTKLPFAYGVMITASHNPPSHNGLKVFTKEGKPNETTRREIESAMLCVGHPRAFPAPLTEDPSSLALYEAFFREKIGRLDGISVVVDFAGGAGYAFKGLLGTLGAKVFPLNARESGDRINENSGALHPENCAETTRRLGADLGFCLDGDGDRIIATDDRGALWDGDRILHTLALRMKARGILRRNKIAMTVMTNGGILKSLSEEGISVISCAVGDSAVAQTMRAEGLSLGGEQSGHIILGDLLMTGDALLVGGALLKSIREDGPLSATPAPAVYPQIKLDVPVHDRKVAEDPSLRALAAEIKEDLVEGRVLLRASGTEDLVRIMIEHPAREKALAAAARLREAIEEKENHN